MKTLIVDPDPESRDALRRAFHGAGAQVRVVANVTEGQKQLAELLPDVILVALDGSSGDAMAFLEEAIASDPRRAAYGLVENHRLDQGIEAMARGAEDFLWRPVSQVRVATLLARLAERREKEARA